MNRRARIDSSCLALRLLALSILAGLGSTSCGKEHEGRAADMAEEDACTSPCEGGGARDGAANTHDGSSHADAGDDAGAGDGAVAEAGSAADASVSCAPFPSFRRDCESASDCALGFRTFNCCGSQLVTGVRADALEAFDRAARHCESLFPACGCAMQATRADDGTVDDFTDSAHPSVTCQHRQCWTSFRSFGGKTPCGSQGLMCDAATELCKSTSGPGNTFATTCVPVPPECSTDRNCACLGARFCSGAATECYDDVFANGVACSCNLCQ